MRIIEPQTFANIANSGRKRKYSPGFLINGAIVSPGHLSMSVYSCYKGIEIKDIEHIYFEGCRIRIEYFSPKYIEDFGTQWNARFIRGNKIESFDAHHTERKGELYIGSMPECKEYELMYHGDPSNFIVHFDLEEKYNLIDKFFEEVVTKNKLTNKEKKYLSSEILRKLSEGVK